VFAKSHAPKRSVIRWSQLCAISWEGESVPYRQTVIGALIVVDEQAAADILLGALADHDGNTVKAAEALDVDHSTLKRWLRKLDARDWNVKVEAARLRMKARAKRGNGQRR
jgi:transcriptional regulator with PAS, ATPase and Fis domain